MDIKGKKNKLLNKEILVSDLNSEEVEKIKKSIQKDLDLKKEELSDLNKKIKEMKKKIDNWAN